MFCAGQYWEDLRTTFAERVAVLELDQELPVERAKARALAEVYDGLVERRAPAQGILGELVGAEARRHDPMLEEVLAACGLVHRRAPAWGVESVVKEGDTYRPADSEPGRPAIVVPADDLSGGIADLVACGLASGRMLARLGAASVVGASEIKLARENLAPLIVFGNTMAWLRGDCRGAVVIDWRRAGEALDGVHTIKCSAAIAPQIYIATRGCWPRPRILVAVSPEARHAA
jgi:hypothetical protein